MLDKEGKSGLFGCKQSYRNRVDGIQSYRLASKPLTFRGRRFFSPFNKYHRLAPSSNYRLIIDRFPTSLPVTATLADLQEDVGRKEFDFLSRITAARSAGVAQNG